LNYTKKGGTALPLKLNKVLIFIILLFALQSKAQVIIADSLEINDSVVAGEFPFINYEADTLITASGLAPFFNKLLKLENGDSCQVNIVHIGDSHIQADFLTREVRKNFQLRFGNSGRGLVFPLRVAGTNEPADYRSSSNIGWSVAKINTQARTPEPGISGISMLTQEDGGYFDITTFDHDDLNYSFSQVTLLHAKDSLQFDCRISDSPAKFGYLMSALPAEDGDFQTQVPFLQPTNFVRVYSVPTEGNQQSATINGVILQNEKPGILYHSIGINGAHFSDYNNSPLFYKQMRVLNPDLIIISLGTNEGANAKITEDEMLASVVAMVKNLKSVNPEAGILITTPADDYYKKKYKNQYLETVQRALVKSAEIENIACWDLYSIAGGYGSCVEWRKAGMLQRDGVHFNKQGYTLQGLLLYNALIDSYLKYAAD
jgi:lysophospholipase L1-like esterase